MTMRPEMAEARRKVCRSITLRFMATAVATTRDGACLVPAAKVPCSRRWLIGEGMAGITADKPRPTAAGDSDP